MKILRVEPGDGTSYRVGYDYTLDEESIKMMGGDPTRPAIFFSFGLGMGPMTSFIFDGEDAPSFEYFREKMDKYQVYYSVWTLWVGFLCLKSLIADVAINPHDIPKEIGNDWGRYLNKGWYNELLSNNVIAYRMGYGIWADEKTIARLERDSNR